jgi:hypothetical protein
VLDVIAANTICCSEPKLDALDVQASKPRNFGYFAALARGGNPPFQRIDFVFGSKS